MSKNLEIAQKIAKLANPKWPKPVGYLGGGVNGRVYKTNNGRLMKFIYNYAPTEYKALKNLQGSFIVPRFKNGNSGVFSLGSAKSNMIRKAMFPHVASNKLSSFITVFIMGKVGDNSSMTLGNYIKKHPGASKVNIQRRVEYLIEQMHTRGWFHGNLHAGNIIVSVTPTGRISGMWVVDFGRARQFAVGATESKWSRSYTPSRMFSTASVFKREPTRIPLFGTRPARLNLNMARVHYGFKIPASKEKQWANRRAFVKAEMNALWRQSPKRRPSSVRRAKSASPAKRKSPSVKKAASL